VSPETQKRVLAAIRQLNYIPNRVGQALQGQRHAALGIVFPDFSGPYYSGVMLGFENQAVTAGYSVVVLATHRRPESTQLIVDLAGRVDGLVMMDRTVSNDTVTDIARCGIPIVLLARSAITGMPCVRCENRQAAEELVGHLNGEHGYRKFAFLGNPDLSFDVMERWQGIQSAIQQFHLPDPDLIRCEYRQADGRQAAHDLLASGQLPECLLCANDEVAFGVYQAMREAGKRIPQDVAVTGWDDVLTADLVDPPLTSVRQPTQQLGDVAAHTLLTMIEQTVKPLSSTILPSRVVFRHSCGCIGKGCEFRTEALRP
jgi:LacI family transcriptional regulator